MNEQNSIRVPQQTRSIEKKKRLMDAAMAEFGAKGFHGTNAKGIAKGAGVSVGTFYAYFTDKKAILFEIINQHLIEIDQSIFKTLTRKIKEGATGREVISHIVKMGHEAHHHSPELLRVMLSMQYIDEDFQEYAATEFNDATTKLSQFFETMSDRLRITDMEAAAQVVANAFEETMHSVATGRPHVEQNRLYNALIDMTSIYLFKDPDVPLSYPSQDN
nr:TetR/AcrR family transcriptional regulator [uncultured Pseudodesulfovibrio sp.]